MGRIRLDSEEVLKTEPLKTIVYQCHLSQEKSRLVPCSSTTTASSSFIFALIFLVLNHDRVVNFLAIKFHLSTPNQLQARPLCISATWAGRNHAWCQQRHHGIIFLHFRQNPPNCKSWWNSREACRLVWPQIKGWDYMSLVAWSFTIQLCCE